MEKQSGSGSGLLDFLEKLDQQKANRATIEFGMNSYFDRIARERGIPLKGTFELTPLCNMNCKMCYIHLSKEQLCKHAKQQMSGAQWIQIIQQAIDHGMMYALLTGGEAMLHPDFDEIYLYLQSQGIQVSVNTNGLLLDEKRISFFQKHHPREIHITLYGANDDAYEAVTGCRVFTKVINAIRQAKAAGLTLVVNITPSCYLPVKDTLSLIELVSSLGVKYGINAALSKPRENTGRAEDSHDMSLDEYIQLYKHMNLLQNKPLQPVCAEEIPLPGGNSNVELKGFRCAGGRSNFAIVWHGAMQPCLTIEDIQADLSTLTFTQAWQQVNKAVLNYRIPRECKGCAFESLCPVCVAQHAEDSPIGHASPRLCQRARRLIQEGLTSLQPR